MRALECLPLVMEPEAGIYTDPVVILDFQALYPSVVIAHNYCYSTCLGKLDSQIGLGCLASYKSWDKEHISFLNNHGLVKGRTQEKGLLCLYLCLESPNGVWFCTKKHREGVLPNMLSEILDIRVLLKQSMRSTSDKAGNPVGEYDTQILVGIQ